MGKLTTQEVKNIKPGSKQQKLTDGEGMYLLVTKTGKYWRYDYRYLKKRKTLALGVYPQITLKKARDLHFEARKKLTEGIDPSHLKKIEKKNTIKQFIVSPTIEGIDQLLDNKQCHIKRNNMLNQSALNNKIFPFPRYRNLPLSSMQLPLWFIKQVFPDSIEYNIPFAIRFNGDLDIVILKQSLNKIIERHESLRTTFKLEKDLSVQVIAKSIVIDIPIIDFHDIEKKNHEMKLKEYLASQAAKSFKLSESPLFRVRIIRLSPIEHVLFFMTHHIVFDGISHTIFQNELFEIYNSLIKGDKVQLPELSIQYTDYSVWQKEWLHSNAYQKQLKYWMDHLKGELPVLQMPLDYQRPAVQTFAGAMEKLLIPDTMVNALSEIGRTQMATLFMVLFDALTILLHRYTNQNDFCIGVPLANRPYKEISNVIGYFTNTQVIRTKIEKDVSFLELLDQTKNIIIGALNNQEMPLERLIEKLNIKRDLSLTPLFQVLFIFLPKPDGIVKLKNISWEPEDIEVSFTQTDLCFTNTFTKDGLNLLVNYNTDLFKPSTIRRLLNSFKVLLEGIITDPSQSISDLPVIPNIDFQNINLWNKTETEYPKHNCLHQLFEYQVEKTPNAIAACFGNKSITYEELNQKANKLANYLSDYDIQPDVFVGICIERSIEMLIALLGILKAGGAYLPLDPDYPDERLAYMIEETKISILITQQSLHAKLPQNNAKNIFIDTDWEKISNRDYRNPILKKEVKPENIAYIIFTSGSTGLPKGVQIPHRAVVNFLTSMADKPGISSDDTLLAVTTLSFDIAVLELFLPLITGAKTVIVSKDTSVNGYKLISSLNRFKVNIMQATPSTWRLMLACGWEGNKDLKILCGGEAFPKDLAHELIGRAKSIWNMYGPTETTVWSTCYKIKNNFSHILIGKPIANTQIYILDTKMQPVPIGCVGELYIGGDSVTYGYLNRDDLTNSAFIKPDFLPSQGLKIYKTGDLAKYHEDGNIEYMGRNDFQLKVRGHRIEPGEIELALIEHVAVKQAVVVLKEDKHNNLMLVAYIIAISDINHKELRSYLHTKLPDYMIPQFFIETKIFQLTPAGKIDRKYLSSMDLDIGVSKKDVIEPKTIFEQQVVKVWKDVLDIEKVSLDDNFFEIGGHSLLSVAIVSKLSKNFKIDIPLDSFLRAPTVEELAFLIEGYVNKGPNKKFSSESFSDNKFIRDNKDSKWASLVPIQPKGSKPPLFCIHAIGGNVLNYYHFSSVIGKDRALYGLQARGLDGLSEPIQTIERMAEHYITEILSIQPQGPYNLCGGCMGGLIAYEIAQQLKKQGHAIDRLILLDTFDPASMAKDRQEYKAPVKERILTKLFNTDKSVKENIAANIFKSVLDRLKKYYKLNVCLIYRFLNNPIPQKLRYWYIEQKHYEPLFNYKPKRYEGDLILLYNSIETDQKENKIIQGWREYITGHLRCIGIQAKHSEFIESSQLLVKLSECFNKEQ